MELVEDRDYKIVRYADNEPYHLDEIAEQINAALLKSEHLGENGWIARFSQFADKVPDDLLPQKEKE